MVEFVSKFHAGDIVIVNIGDSSKLGEVLYKMDNSKVDGSKPGELYYVVSFSVDMDDYTIVESRFLRRRESE